MRTEVYEWIRNNAQAHYYLRTHPIWYRKLSRDPDKLSEMLKEVNMFYGKTIPQRVEKIHNNLNLAMMMLDMMKQVKE